jgi:VanW like protein
MTVEPWRLPRRGDALSYWLRTRLLSLRAVLRQWLPHWRDRRWPVSAELVGAPVIAQHRSALWAEETDGEFALTAGKVENLRRALRAFDGVEVPAGGVLSFWAQLGRPVAARGFVVGREIREGCVVPTVAGGICQLTNALSFVATQAGLALVEHHRHSARVGAPAKQDADATVFWRHVDLKMRAAHAWRLEVAMDSHELVVSLRALSGRSLPRSVPLAQARESAVASARGCLTCDERQCFRHARHRGLHGQQARAVALLSGWSPEFDAWLEAQPWERWAPPPLRLAFWRPSAPSWREAIPVARRASLRGALWRRLWARHAGGRRQACVLDAQRWLAEACAVTLTPLHTRLVIDQALLPHLERLGVLAGREIEVLAHALPMGEIHARLDAAAQHWPAAASLRDFRASPDLVAAEWRGLARARRIVTPHAEVAAVLRRLPGVEVLQLDWVEPPGVLPSDGGPGGDALLLFPGPAQPRKGACELAAALAGLRCRLRVTGRTDAASWPGVALDMRPVADPLDGVAAVVLPAHVEHAPRLLLRALAQGVPVIATPACGLAPRPGLTLIAAGDVDVLRRALEAALAG